MINAVQTFDDCSCFMQQKIQVMSLHVNKRIMLNNFVFNQRNQRRAKTQDHPRASIKIFKYVTNKFVIVSALANTGAQSNLWRWKIFQDTDFCKSD